MRVPLPNKGAIVVGFIANCRVFGAIQIDLMLPAQKPIVFDAKQFPQPMSEFVFHAYGLLSWRHHIISGSLVRNYSC